MPVKTYFAESLGEYFDIISKASNNTDAERPEILWFRGVSRASHCLIPAIFRTSTRADGETYTKLHYAEDIRTQHYVAKNYHYFSSPPSSKLEWLEVMQHHGVKTRALDWSESSVHSLLFSLEAFFDNKRYCDEERQKWVPCVWVLKPGSLSEKIHEMLFQDKELQEQILEEVFPSMSRFKIRKIVKLEGKFWEKTGDIRDIKDIEHLNYILNLSAVSNGIHRNRKRIEEELKQGKLHTPFYFFVSRIYSDGFVLKKRKLPPIPIVQPYHSERIKAQKGVFTVFPFYGEQRGENKLREMGMNPDALENNKAASECMVKIVISNPQKVAYQLMENGMNDSWLYPELPIVANEIENHRIY